MLKSRLFLILLLHSLCNGEDAFFNINNKKVLHKVSDKYLSISVDPAVLFAGVNLSDTSLLLATHLSPAFIRLAGPSTSFVKYKDEEEEFRSPKAKDESQIIINPSMWFGINEWFNLANLTPVFGINDNETEKGVWNPQSTLPLLEISDKFTVNCYWQLGFDCSNKTTVQYVEDLNILKQTLNTFPEHNETWKIVGSDFSKCISDDSSSQQFEKYINDLDETVDAVMWESMQVSRQELGFTEMALWTSVPKDSNPVTFSSAMSWAIQVGDAAKMGYDVIFRQPRLHEMAYDTPVYWLTFLHKKLMGSNVLDIKPTYPNTDLTIYAHCTKRQNNFVRSGAITILLINNGTEDYKANLRLGSFLLEKSMEVQSYLMTSNNDTSTDIYLNDEKLTMDMLKRSHDILKPKLRRAKIRPHISLEIPLKSIAFFVLTGAKYSICSNNEEEINSILEEINGDQESSLSEEVQFNIEERSKGVEKKEKVTLESIKKNMLHELELDKKFYRQMQRKIGTNINFKPANKKDLIDKKEMLHNHLKSFIDRSRKNDQQKDLLINKNNSKDKTQKTKAQRNNLNLTIQELEDILKRRAKAKAAKKKIQLSSSELDMLVDKATIRLPKNLISKRDINKILLEEKSNYYMNNMFSQEVFDRFKDDTKIFPKFKYRRSAENKFRSRKSINQALLNLKAKLEENKKYMLQKINNIKLRQTNNKIKNKSLHNRRKTRDINLDLLKKRTGATLAQNKDKRKNPHSHKSFFKDEGLFKDFDESDEDPTVEDINMPSGIFSDLGTLDEEDFDYEDLIEQKSKRKNKLEHLFSQPKMDIVLPRKPNTKKNTKLNSDEILQFLSASDEMGKFSNDYPYLREFEFQFKHPNSDKKTVFTQVWETKRGKIGKSKDEKPIFDDLDFSAEMDYGFLRRKRSSESFSKDKYKLLKKNIKTKVKGLKKQLKEGKRNYHTEKLKNKVELRRQEKELKRKRNKTIESPIQNLVIKRKDKVLKSKSKNSMESDTKANLIQIIDTKTVKDKKSTENVPINKIIAEAKSYENIISPTVNLVKRSLKNNNIFGTYKPLTSAFRPWKPSDMLSLNRDYFNTLPLYNLIQDANLKTFLNRQKYFGFRKRRYIESGSVNYLENEIESKEDWKKGERVKKQDLELIKEHKTGKLSVLNYTDSNTEKKLNGQTSTEVLKQYSYVDHIDNTNSRHSLEDIKSEKRTSAVQEIVEKEIKKPLRDFAGRVKEVFNTVNENISSYLKNIF